MRCTFHLEGDPAPRPAPMIRSQLPFLGSMETRGPATWMSSPPKGNWRNRKMSPSALNTAVGSLAPAAMSGNLRKDGSLDSR